MIVRTIVPFTCIGCGCEVAQERRGYCGACALEALGERDGEDTDNGESEELCAS